MERLTGRHPSGLVYVPQGMLPEALDLLAAYEDTGLEPEEIERLLTKFAEFAEVYEKVDFDHLRNLIQAEKESRLVVLPCKVGDKLYITEPRFYNYEKHEGVQQGVCRSYEMGDRWGWVVKVELDEGEPHTLYFYGFSKFGKTVFLTREEAEAALKGEAVAENATTTGESKGESHD